MAQKFKNKAEEIAHEEKYMEFLRNALSSENFKKNDPDGYKKSQQKYDKAKLRLRLLKMERK